MTLLEKLHDLGCTDARLIADGQMAGWVHRPNAKMYLREMTYTNRSGRVITQAVRLYQKDVGSCNVPLYHWVMDYLDGGTIWCSLHHGSYVDPGQAAGDWDNVQARFLKRRAA